jgi:hypothetical protein
MERKFKQPVSMPCNQGQFDEFLKEELYSIGIKPFWMEPQRFHEGNNIVVDNWAAAPNGCYFSAPTSNCAETHIPEFNPDLFLAIAAMSQGDEFCPGEWAVCLWKGSTVLEFEGLYKVHHVDDEFLYPEPYSDKRYMYLKSDDGPNFRKATVGELTEYFTKPKAEKSPEPTSFFDQIADIIKPKVHSQEPFKVNPETIKEFTDRVAEIAREALKVSAEKAKGYPNFPSGGTISKNPSSEPESIISEPQKDKFKTGDLVICFNNGKHYCTGYYIEPSVSTGHYVFDKLTGVLCFVEEARRPDPVKVTYDELLKSYAQHKGIDVSQIEVIPAQ